MTASTSSSGRGLRSSSLALSALALLAIAAPAHAQPTSSSVQIPLSVYEELSHGASRRAPANHAIGTASVTADVSNANGVESATITAALTVRVHADEWTLVPLLPLGAAIASATVGGSPVELVATDRGLAWATETRGSHSVVLVYRVDAARSGEGRAIAIPLPLAPSSQLTATLPEAGLSASVVPASAVSVTSGTSSTVVMATLPATPSVQLAWQTAGGEGYTLSRASYRGEVDGAIVRWTATFGVELGSESAVIDILPVEVALQELTADDAQAPIDVRGESFTVSLRGRGRHTVVASFETPVVADEGLPRVDLHVPMVPVSRFELSIAGNKDVRVTPGAGVRVSRARERTVATFHVAMTDTVTIEWPEAVPEGETAVETRANASIVHVVHAEEGVLHVRAIAGYEVTHGAVSSVSLAVPSGIQVNTVACESAGISDWRVTTDREPALLVFFDRAIEGALELEISYERALEATAGESAPFDVPLLLAKDVHRQRGMVALLSSRELTLEPRSEEQVTRVGENQLPAEIRDSIDMTVAHTYRYVDATPLISAVTAARQREEARFDARVDTLFSIGEPTTTGTAIVDVDVKSGSLAELAIVLPANAGILDLSAPSLRDHHTETSGDTQTVTVEFTQEMEGQFRVELRYERIAEDGEGELAVPIAHVRGADVEQGRIAVEALSAVQVDPARTERLSTTEVAELPQQLVLRTTNPILLAYKYARATPPPELALRITRHAAIVTQDATIDEATYHTLYTSDGFAVTRAELFVRNQRKQFLRVVLPQGSEVWSARVNGVGETPARADDDDEGRAILLNIINSAEGFPVELVYATRVSPVGVFGRLGGELPLPDMVVTRSQWDVYVPADADWGTPDSDMTLVERASFVEGDVGLVADSPDGLRIRVPAEGVHFRFEKLYAGQTGDAATFSIPYTSRWGSAASTSSSLAGALFVWLGLFGLLLVRLRVLRFVRTGAGVPIATYRTNDEGRPEVDLARGAAVVLAATAFTGFLLLVATLGYLSTSPTAAIALSIVFVLGGAAALLRPKLAGARAALERARIERRARREARAAAPAKSEPKAPEAPASEAPLEPEAPSDPK
jgi:hypothetical protein